MPPGSVALPDDESGTTVSPELLTTWRNAPSLPLTVMDLPGPSLVGSDVTLSEPNLAMPDGQELHR